MVHRRGTVVLLGLASLIALLGGACDSESDGGDAAGNPGAGGAGSGAGTGTGGATTGTGGGGGAGGGGTGGSGGSLPSNVTVHLVPQAGVSGVERVNFAVPLVPGQLQSADDVRVLQGGTEIATARRGLAQFADGSFRSVQLQADVMIAGETDLEVQFGAPAGAGDLTLDPVESTLEPASGEQGPRVWALLPAAWLSSSGVAGQQRPEADVEGTPLAAWTLVCDYSAYDTAAFLADGAADTRAVWLYDRGTTMYRGYARRGDLVTLESAYRESSMYRNLITGTGTSARNGLPEGAGSDPKYTYAQNLAIHYLLTGDDRFRDSAEDMALGMSELWPDPGYAGGADMWTERNAGFALLAYTWALIVTDDKTGELRALADEAANATIDVQETYPVGYDDPDARCFAHHGDAHDPDEGNPYFGCSPWMSAILADALDAYASASDAPAAEKARASIVKLGRILAREGRDTNDIPYYWMGVDDPNDAPDEFTEHIGESAYVIAMAWHHAGGADDALKQAADVLVAKFGSDASAPHVRSFNWQCRSAVGTAFYLP
jgi:hypothetical protein